MTVGAGQSQRPAAGGGDPVGEAGEAGAGTRPGAAVAVVADLDGDLPVGADDGQADRGGLGVFDGVGQCLAGDVVGGGGDVVG